MKHGLPESQGASQALFRSCVKQVALCLHHPFISALAQGTLPRACFQHYVAQDAHFLHFFGQAYAAALSKCTDALAEHAPAIQGLLDGVKDELKLHSSFAAQWGVDLSEHLQPSAATKAYTDFLMETCRTEGLAGILAAMAPCSRLYGYLGCQLALSYPTASHQYSEWIKTYSSDEYLALPALKEGLLDSLVQCGAAPSSGRLTQLYKRAMQLEVEFFSAQPCLPPPKNIGVLVVDFDESLTEKDTISTLMSVAEEVAAKGAASPEARQAAVDAVREKTRRLADNYMAKQQEVLAQILPRNAALIKGNRNYDLEIVGGFLMNLSDFDKDMNQVVVESGILRGFDLASIKAAADKVVLRPNAAQVLSRARQLRVPVHVLSVNWSTEFVARALGIDDQPTFSPDYTSANLDLISIHANELEFSKAGISTGGIVASVQGATDKGLVFEDLLLEEACRTPRGGQGGQGEGAGSSGGAGASQRRSLSVYVGDSTSDMLPLLGADIGIVIGSNQLLRRVCSEFNVQLRPLVSAPAEPPASAPNPPVLYEADSWYEIEAFLFGAPSPDSLKTSSSLAAATMGAGVPARTATIAAAGSLMTSGALAAAVAAAAAAEASGRSSGSGSRQDAQSSLPRVLTVAGSDSGGGAGVQADLKAIMACGAFGTSAITALTAQNTHGVHAVHPVPRAFLEAQLDAVLGDIGADVVKTGMLPDAEAVQVVATKVAQWGVRQLVLDPVMVATSGDRLADDSAGRAILELLLPLATIVTPNVPEAEALLGAAPGSIRSTLDMMSAAERLVQLGAKAVLVKGGHVAADMAQQGAVPEQVVDVLHDGSTCHELALPYIATGNTHGTGCTLASAIAARLAAGDSLVTAVQHARTYLHQALSSSAALCLGSGMQRPFNHSVAPAGWLGSTAGGVRGGYNKCDLRVYAVTDPGCNKKRNRTLVEAVRLAVEGGCTIVQLREKDCDGGDFVQAAKQVLQVCRPKGVPVIINDRIDVALAASADGVHIGQSDIPAAAARQLLGPSKILGVSVKRPEEARQAQADGADYVGAGAVYPTSTKDSSVIGLEGLAAVCAAVDIPVVSIGGVGLGNAGATVAAGCAGVAVVSAVFAAEDPAAASRQLREEVEAALAVRGV